MSEPDILDQLLKRISGLTKEERLKLEKETMKATGSLKWTPNPGPQMNAYYSKADILLYGGQGGGGKSDLLLGLAFNEHRRSLLIRRRYGDLSALIERALEINGSRKGYSGATPPSLRIDSDKLLEFGGCAHAGDEQSWQGRPHDFLGLEEGAQLLKSQAQYLMGWVRTTVPGQRTRVVIASNPPLSDEGQWLFEMFRPWVDRNHPHPARPGELRWFITDPDGNDVETDGPGLVTIEGETYKPLSRTFIPAAMIDNPFLRDTNYQAQLDALPEPLRSAIRDGDFTAGRVDDPWQLIPTDWIYQAQNRWTEEPPKAAPMCAMGVDVAQGGTDETVLAPRYDWWYGPMIAVPGKETPYGTDVAALVIKHRRNNASIVVDMGGGYGGAAYEHLKQNLEGSPNGEDQIVFGYKGAQSASGRTRDRQLGFYNRRAETWWRFREALDPDQPGGAIVALPPDNKLVADLVAPRFEVNSRGIKVEEKTEIIKRLGRSTDRGDAVVMAWAHGATHQTHGSMWRDFEKTKGRAPTVVHGHENKKRFRRRR